MVNVKVCNIMPAATSYINNLQLRETVTTEPVPLTQTPLPNSLVVMWLKTSPLQKQTQSTPLYLPFYCPSLSLCAFLSPSQETTLP